MSDQSITKAGNIRVELKNIVDREVKKLPELLDELNPKDRIQVTFKLMSLVIPKVKAVHYKDGESPTFDFL